MDNYLKLSSSFFNAVKTGNGIAETAKELEQLHLEELCQGLIRDTDKMVFWLNIYNAQVQLLLKTKDQEHQQKRKVFFRTLKINIGGTQFSLDYIEHNLLRRSQFKYGLGYISLWNVSSLEKKLRVSKVDPKIHFALNCGATSCPPILLYSATNLEKELRENAKEYLEEELEEKGKYLYLPGIIQWYIGDFGGTKGVRRFLHELGLPNNGRIKFKFFDWTIQKNKYKIGH